jgi:hypothetical protein
MRADEFIADLLMLAHAGYSLFVVLGLMMILLGMVLRWRWSRNRYFRVAHLAATIFLILRVWIGLACPFSATENVLRSRITMPCPLGGAFHDVLHYCAFRGTSPGYFAGSTMLLGILALAAFVLSRETRDGPQTTGTA